MIYDKWWNKKIQILLNQFYKHRTAADHAGDLLAIRLASINQTLDPWVYIFSKKVIFCSSSFLSFGFSYKEVFLVRYQFITIFFHIKSQSRYFLIGRIQWKQQALKLRNLTSHDNSKLNFNFLLKAICKITNG